MLVPHLGLEDLVDGWVHVLEDGCLSVHGLRDGHLVQVTLGGGVHNHDLHRAVLEDSAADI